MVEVWIADEKAIRSLPFGSTTRQTIFVILCFPKKEASDMGGHEDGGRGGFCASEVRSCNRNSSQQLNSRRLAFCAAFASGSARCGRLNNGNLAQELWTCDICVIFVDNNFYSFVCRCCSRYDWHSRVYRFVENSFTKREFTPHDMVLNKLTMQISKEFIINLGNSWSQKPCIPETFFSFVTYGFVNSPELDNLAILSFIWFSCASSKIWIRIQP